MKQKNWNYLSNISFALFLIAFVLLMFMAVKGIVTGREPELLNHKMYLVNSGSMSLTIKTGSLIIVKNKEVSPVYVQDVVIFRSSNNVLVTHRIVGISDDGNYLTKGDANTTNDPITLKKENIIGKVVSIIPYVGFILSLVRTRIGLTILIFIIMVISAINIADYYKKNKNKKLEDSK